MLKKEDDLMVGNDMTDKTTNRAYLASATASAQILLRRTSDMLEETLDEIFMKYLKVRVKGRIRDGKSERAECQWGDRGIQSFQECCSDVLALHKV